VSGRSECPTPRVAMGSTHPFFVSLKLLEVLLVLFLAHDGPAEALDMCKSLKLLMAMVVKALFLLGPPLVNVGLSELLDMSEGPKLVVAMVVKNTFFQFSRINIQIALRLVVLAHDGLQNRRTPPELVMATVVKAFSFLKFCVGVTF
jgi:hypothetical protein